MAYCIVSFGLFVTLWSLALASDQSPLQDLCVANLNDPVLVNGFTCKDSNLVQAEDFLFKGFHIAGDTLNPVGSQVTSVSVRQIPGLNTLGISMVRIDFEQGGINPPHTHPRASEMLTVIEGSLEVGFVTTIPGKNRLITKFLEVGDVFVFPEGLIHFQRNVGLGKAIAIGALSSQNPGVIRIANALFGSKPHICVDFFIQGFSSGPKQCLSTTIEVLKP